MKYLHKIREKACEALDTIGQSSDKLELMNDADRKLVYELVDIVKDIGRIEELEGAAGYSGRMSRAGDDYSGRMDSMGRFSNAGYSHASAKREMMEHLERAYDSAPDEEHRRMAREMMERVGQI